MRLSEAMTCPVHSDRKQLERMEPWQVTGQTCSRADSPKVRRSGLCERPMRSAAQRPRSNHWTASYTCYGPPPLEWKVRDQPVAEAIRVLWRLIELGRSRLPRSACHQTGYGRDSSSASSGEVMAGAPGSGPQVDDRRSYVIGRKRSTGGKAGAHPVFHPTNGKVTPESKFPERFRLSSFRPQRDSRIK